MSNQKTLSFRTATARLLATENIVVNQTNSKTAWFDVEKRILNLPMWDVEDYVYDMLVGHEVGHALYTPADGWHDSIKDLGIPRSYINVVEDARIEKMVKRKYPGIVNTFSRAYGWMHKNDFFNLDGRDLYSMSLIDRINCKFKLGQSMFVPFTAEENQFVDMVEDCETFDQVVDTCKAIMEFWKENKKNLQEQLQDLKMSLDDDDYSDEDDYEEADSNDAFGQEDGEYQETDEKKDGRFKQETSKESGEDLTPEDDAGTSGSTTPETEEALTDVAQRSNESSMLSDQNGGVIIKFFPRSFVKEMIVPHAKYHAQPRVAKRRPLWREWADYCKLEWKDIDRAEITYDDYCKTIAFKKFLNDTNRVVTYLAKEFEQKKAAYQYSRAKVSTTGVLNTSALHKYKFSEDVFKRTMSLADAKSHGMIISVDMSGSMSDVIYDTLVQALNLAMFCRRVNIPFEMYTFTTGARDDEYDSVRNMFKEVEGISGTVMPYNVDINQLFGSKMTKTQFDNAVRNVFLLAAGFYNRAYDGMGSTPTNETLMALRYIIEDFQSRHRVQKLINVVLTDGEPNRVNFERFDGSTYFNRYRGTLQVSGSKFVKINNLDTDLSVRLLEYLRDQYKVVNLGYFLGDQNTMRRAIMNCANNSSSSWEAQNKIRGEIRKHGSYAQENVCGYDQYFLIKSSKFSVQDDEFEVDQNASKKQLAREFSKFAKGRRQSRVLLDKFVKIVA